MKKLILAVIFGFLATQALAEDLTDKTADTSPTADDIIYVVNDPGGTPADRKVTLGNAAKALTVTDMISSCTDAQVLGGTAAGTGVECQVAAGGGDVAKVGTPVNDQVGVWTGDGTIEGDANLTFDTTTDVLAVGGGLDAVGAVDMDYGSADVTDHTFVTDSTGTAEIVLPAGAIDGTEILDDTIDSADYAAGSIDTEHIAADQITSALIADDQIDSEHYAAGSIDTEHIAADQITSALIADDQIDSEHYVADSIDEEHMAANSIDSDSYVDGSIDEVHIAAAAQTGTDTTMVTGTAGTANHGSKWDANGDLITSGYLECPNETHVVINSSTYTVGGTTGDVCQCYGGVLTPSTTTTILACDNLAQGMNFTVITNVAAAVHVDVQADNTQILDGTGLDAGDKASSGETAGEVIKLNYLQSTTWITVSDGWSDGG